MADENKNEAEQSREASDREAFDKFLSKAVTEGEEAEQPSEGGPDGGDDGKADGDVDSEPKESSKLKSAKEFLRLKSVPQAILDSADEDTILQWRDGVQERESKVSRTYEELAETKRELEDLRKQLSENQAAREAEPAVPAAELDLAEVKARLKESLGDEEGDALADTLKTVLEPLQARIAEQERAMRNAMERNEEIIKRSNRERLTQRLPQLEDEDAWEDFQAAVESRLNRNGKTYSSVEELYDATARGIYGEDALSGRQEKEPEPEPAASSSPNPPTRKRSSTNLFDAIRSTNDPDKREKLKLSADRAAFDHLQRQSGDIRGAQRAQGIKV